MLKLAFSIFILILPSYGCAIYQSNNPFWKILKGELSAIKTLETPHSLIFKDKRMRVKVHYLAIPKGTYISFSNFIDKASDKEIIDLTRSIPLAAKKLGVSKSGYRIITNGACYPGASHDNNAYQEIAHFHVHIAGGECLGLPVAGFKDQSLSLSDSPANTRYKIDNSILPNHYPFGYKMNAHDLLVYATKHKHKEFQFTNQNNEIRKVISFNVHDNNRILINLGVIILNLKDKILYKSFDDFARNADNKEIINFLKIVRNIIKSTNLDKTGYRLYSNSGPDSWNQPEKFQFFIAGGTILGPTVTNVYGNKKTPDYQQEGNFFYYDDLKTLSHQSCPIE